MAGSGQAQGANDSGDAAHPRFAAMMGQVTDELRRQMGAVEYIHVVFPPVFRMYISETFQEHRSGFSWTCPEEAEDREGDHTKEVCRVPRRHAGDRPCPAPGRAQGSRVL